MWSSSNAFVGINRDSETTLQSIGQYIDDYIDLVENVPNDIVRGITQFHEKNHLYHQLLDRLESSLERAIACPDGDDAGRRSALMHVQKYLIDIQSLSDDKLTVGQAIFEQLELKSRQLDLDIRAITAGQGGASIFSPIKSTSRHSHNNESGLPAHPPVGSRSSGSTSQYATNSRNHHNSHNNNNGNNTTATASGPVAGAQVTNHSEESQDSSVSPDHNNETTGAGDNISANHPATSGRGKKRGVKGTSASNNNNNHHHHSDNDEDNDADNESPVKETVTPGTKRTRRGAGSSSGAHHPASKKHHNQQQHQNTPSDKFPDLQDDVHHTTPSHHTPHHGPRGGKSGTGSGTGGGKGGHRVKGHAGRDSGPRRGRGAGSTGGTSGAARESSPPSIYDEPSALDPDEPTYCVCQQISFGEMIGCDNARCPIEWFHFACVHLTNKPKGKWYCPQCRGDRSNIQRK